MYAQICEGIADSPEVLELIAAHRPESHQPNLLMAAVHYLLLGGLDHGLGPVYFEQAPGDPSQLFNDLVLSNRAEIDALLSTRSTQTNEVGRCSVLAALLQQIATTNDRPLGWIDLGSSAGLNLGLDHFRITYDHDVEGATSIGPSTGSVNLQSATTGTQPRLAADHAPVEWRVGVDRTPIDATNPDEARWLQACLWPSALERGARLKAAIGVAQDSPPRLIKADAVQGLRQALAEMPADLTAVVTTSWVWYYLPADTRAELLELMQGSERRVHWASLEGTGVVETFGESLDHHAIRSSFGIVSLGAGLPDECELIGQCHPHGNWIEWT